MDTRQKKILYRAHHRGMTEADRLLGGFANLHLESMSELELAEFELLLEKGDNTLMNWIMAGQTDDPDFVGTRVLQRIIMFKDTL
ncbi:MAG: succinate dehydrogenase assembly factor 2 [Pseudomonadota bacterium]|nr:succinate dehydrogenase assembly factor 2 [Pseudomonadota bacterium]